MNATDLIRRAMAEFTDHRPDQARTLLEQALQLDPDNLQAISNLGNLDLLGKDAAAAEQRFRQALTRDPTFVPAAFGLTKALLGQRRLDDALPPIQSVRDHLLPEQEAEFYQLIGIVLAGKQDWDAAITFFGKYADRRPDQLDPVLCLHKAYIGKEDLPGAVAQIERAVEIEPGQTPLWVRMVTLYHQLQAPAPLRGACQRMLDAHPEDTSLYNLAVRLLQETRQYAYAARLCRRALERTPDFDRTQYVDLARMEALL